jgi:hypothetical protein
MFPFATMKRLTRVKGDGKRVVDTSNLVAMTEKYIKGLRVERELLDKNKFFIWVELGFSTNRMRIGATFQTEGKKSLYQFLAESQFSVVDPLPREIVDSIWSMNEFVGNVWHNYPQPFAMDKWLRPSMDNMLKREAWGVETPSNGGFFGR